MNSTAANKTQAAHVLAAFRYQLLRSLDAWIGLSADEVLWLEVEEDFSVISSESALHVQVKHSVATPGPTPRSLNSADVRETINRYWMRSNQGTDERSHVAFIANSGAAREQNLSFPGNSPGLVYWTSATLDGDTSAIRVALATIFADGPIGRWIAESPSDEELRARLLRRIQWMLNASDATPLAGQIRDKLAAIYISKGLWATLADENVNSLVGHVLDIASAREPTDRKLTAIDLHRQIEASAAPTAALQASSRIYSNAVIDDAAGSLFVSKLTLVQPNITDRQHTVDHLLRGARGEPVVWLHGTHGVGKSTLARLIGARTGGSWLNLDLRSVQDDAKAALPAWRELIRALLNEKNVAGIIIDDLSGAALEALWSRLSALVTSVSSRGTRVLVTSAHPPSLARLIGLGASERAVVQSPYFAEEDIRALVASPRAPERDMIDAWTRLIQLTTNGGHPLLVAVKVSSLRSRGWPTSALLEDIGPVASDAVQATRDEFRRRLLDEIPSAEGRQLLRRLGSIFDRADQTLILKLARAHPPLQNASDVLAVLRGSWIEVIPPNDMRLSPLIADIGQDVDQTERLRWRQIAAEYWLSTRVLNNRTLPLCFWNAFLGKHTYVLTMLCQTIQTLPAERLRSAASMLSPMTAFSTERSIYDEVPPVAAMLRLLQFEIADAVEDAETANRVANRLIVEIDEIEYEELRLLEGAIAIPKLLQAEHAGLSHKFQLECAIRLRQTQEQIASSQIPSLKDANASLPGFLKPGLDLAGFLFAVIVMRIRSSDGMLAMIEALNELGQADRNSFIDAAAVALELPAGSFVHNGWAQEQLDNIDLHPALERFNRMIDIARLWGRNDFLTQLVCAQSVILDEGLNDQEAAANVIEAAIQELGNATALLRQKAKVLDHAGQSALSARLLISIEDEVSNDQPFDRSLALRDGAVAAAKSGFFLDAARLFTKAIDTLEAEGNHAALAIGLKVDLALTYWAERDRRATLTTLGDALDQVEVLDPAASLQNERAHQYARAAIGSLWRDLDPFPSADLARLSIGQASVLVGDGPVLNIELKSLADNWRILAICEIELDIAAGIEARSLAKQSGPGLGSIEFTIASARYARSIARGELEFGFRYGVAAVSASKLLMRLQTGSSGEVRVEPAELERATFQDALAEGHAEFLCAMPNDVFIWRRFKGTWDSRLHDQLDAACIAAWGSSSLVEDVLGAAEGRQLDTSAAAALAFRLRPSFSVRGHPAERFFRDQLLVCHTKLSFARRVLEPVVVAEISDGWLHVLNKEGFALRAPMRYGPLIKEKIDDARASGLAGTARLLLVALEAVNAKPGPEWLRLLRTIAAS